MTVKLKTVERINPRKPHAKAKYYLAAKSKGKTGIDELAAIISSKSSISRPDIYAVTIAVVEGIIEELSNGKSVSLGQLGSFSVSVHSEGAPTAKKATVANVKSARIVYRPGAEIKDMLKTLIYVKE